MSEFPEKYLNISLVSPLKAPIYQGIAELIDHSPNRLRANLVKFYS